MSLSIAERAPWLRDAELQKLLTALSAGGEQARIAGGAVRNTLLGEAVTDIDIATTTPPEQTTARAEAAGFKVVPTGYEHGTVTIVAHGTGYETTTLRADIETHGRHATVHFGRDWQADAERRDFTINALYAEADGTVVDLVGGVADIETRTLRFIGDPEERIREDNLRILRFFRFFAWYGHGRPDAAGLRACVRLRDTITTLSAERVWAELRRLLGAPDPARALLWMRQAGVLSIVLPESAKWGIDAVHPLVEAEKALGWEPDALVRLEAIVPPDGSRMAVLAERLRLSNAERDRLIAWASAETPDPEVQEAGLAKLLYRAKAGAMEDRLRLALVAARGRARDDDSALVEANARQRQLDFALDWERPRFPLRGADLLAQGGAPGPELGARLKRLEESWVESGFALSRAELLALGQQAD